ncbi:MAG: hypothetical protein AAF291_04625 [Pseudomonadota bacterium]
MSTRISKTVLIGALALAACAPESDAPQGASVECALGEGASFNKDCVLESVGDGDFTIHHPDATFQRVRYDAKTGALTSADGADELAMDPDPLAGKFAFSVGTARYRITRADLVAPGS